MPTLMLALVHSELISSSASSTDPSVVDTAPTFLNFWVQNTGDTSTTNVEGQTSTEFSQQKASTLEIKDVHLGILNYKYGETYNGSTSGGTSQACYSGCSTK